MLLEPLDAQRPGKRPITKPIQRNPAVCQDGLFLRISVMEWRNFSSCRNERTVVLASTSQVQAAVEDEDRDALYVSFDHVPCLVHFVGGISPGTERERYWPRISRGKENAGIAFPKPKTTSSSEFPHRGGSPQKQQFRSTDDSDQHDQQWNERESRHSEIIGTASTIPIDLRDSHLPIIRGHRAL